MRCGTYLNINTNLARLLEPRRTQYLDIGLDFRQAGAAISVSLQQDAGCMYVLRSAEYHLL